MPQELGQRPHQRKALTKEHDVEIKRRSLPKTIAVALKSPRHLNAVVLQRMRSHPWMNSLAIRDFNRPHRKKSPAKLLVARASLIPRAPFLCLHRSHCTSTCQRHQQHPVRNHHKRKSSWNDVTGVSPAAAAAAAPAPGQRACQPTALLRHRTFNCSLTH